MKFKVGDKVKFLNEKGGGTVTKIISPGLVHVSIEDGFDVPVMPGELVLDISEKKEDITSETTGHPETLSKPEIHAEKEDEFEERKSAIDKVAFRGDYAKGIYLAFVPHDQRWLITGEIDVYLINHTSYEVLFSLFLKDEKGFYGFDYDVLTPGSKILIDTIEREEIEKWTKGLVQCLFHMDEPDKIPMPANITIDIKASRVYKEGNYKETPLISEKAFVLNLLEMNLHPLHTSDEITRKFADPVITQKAKVKKKQAIIDKYKTAEKEAVVDLHIGELIDNISGLSSSDMLKIQKDHFIKALESAIAEKYKRVTFIHGVGNGVLKNEIIKMMQDYENAENQSASLAKYGVGAVDVVINPLQNPYFYKKH